MMAPIAELDLPQNTNRCTGSLTIKRAMFQDTPVVSFDHMSCQFYAVLSSSLDGTPRWEKSHLHRCFSGSGFCGSVKLSNLVGLHTDVVRIQGATNSDAKAIDIPVKYLVSDEG